MYTSKYAKTWRAPKARAEIFQSPHFLGRSYASGKCIFVVSTILLQSFWNNVEVFILGLCIGGIVMFFYRLFIGQELEDKIHKEPNKYHNFHHVIIWDEV